MVLRVYSDRVVGCVKTYMLMLLNGAIAHRFSVEVYEGRDAYAVCMQDLARSTSGVVNEGTFTSQEHIRRCFVQVCQIIVLFPRYDIYALTFNLLSQCTGCFRGIAPPPCLSYCGACHRSQMLGLLF